ncbi:MAG TPA: nuclear transport factor 2 family protein [Ilumatobacteraceae bacterium]|jgi:3-phenylpropionate/cinnamic acid dioxygenase small subunit
MDLQGVADRLEIAELLARYARGLDTKDWDLWRSVFLDDSYIDYRSAGGVDGNRHEVSAWLEKTFAPFPMSQHAITNIECEIDGDEALVRAIFHNPVQFPGITGPSFYGGSYQHRMRRTADGWRSVELIEHTAWTTNGPTP